MAALDALAGMDNPGRLRGEVGVSIIGSWSEDDPEAAFEWVRGQELSRVRTAMLSTALANLGHTDPLRALTLANDLDGTERSLAIESVLGVWGREDPRAAAAWLDASGDKTAAAVTEVARHYADADPEVALEWLQDQSDEAQRRAVSMIVRRLAAESPESALRTIKPHTGFRRPTSRRIRVDLELGGLGSTGSDPCNTTHRRVHESESIPDRIQSLVAIRPRGRDGISRPNPVVRPRRCH